MHKCKLSDCVKEINNRTTENNQYEVLTSSKNGIFSQEEYFDKQVASKDNTGYKIIEKGQFTYRSMSDSGTFTINRLEDKDIGIVSPAYPVFEATNIDAEFLKYYFKSELFNKAIINLSQGSTRTALKFKDLIDIEIFLPEIEEQKKTAMHRINLLHSSCSFSVYLTFVISFAMFPYGLLPSGTGPVCFFIPPAVRPPRPGTPWSPLPFCSAGWTAAPNPWSSRRPQWCPASRPPVGRRRLPGRPARPAAPACAVRPTRRKWWPPSWWRWPPPSDGGNSAG